MEREKEEGVSARMTKRRSWAEDYADIHHHQRRLRLNGRSKSKKRSREGVRLETRPAEATANSLGRKEAKRKKRENRIEACSSHWRRSSSCHRQVDVWSKSVSKTHHGGGLWSSEVARLIASPATNTHQGPADGKLIKGPGSSLGSQSGGWSIVAFSLHVSAERCQIAHVVCCSSSG